MTAQKRKKLVVDKKAPGAMCNNQCKEFKRKYFSSSAEKINIPQKYCFISRKWELKPKNYRFLNYLYISRTQWLHFSWRNLAAVITDFQTLVQLLFSRFFFWEIPFLFCATNSLLVSLAQSGLTKYNNWYFNNQC